MLRKWQGQCLVVFLFLIWPINGVRAAISVEIENPYFYPADGKLNQICFVKNIGETVCAAEIQPKNWSMSLLGEDLMTDTSDFLVYPNKFLLKPGESVAATVSWMGPMDLLYERAYRLVVQEIPISSKLKEKYLGKTPEKNDSGSSFGITVVLRFLKNIYASPQNAAPNVALTSVKLKKNSNDLILVLENRGTKHYSTQSITLAFQKEGHDSVTHEIAIANRLNIIAREKQELIVPMPSSVSWPCKVTLLQSE